MYKHVYVCIMCVCERTHVCVRAHVCVCVCVCECIHIQKHLLQGDLHAILSVDVVIHVSYLLMLYMYHTF